MAGSAILSYFPIPGINLHIPISFIKRAKMRCYKVINPYTGMLLNTNFGQRTQRADRVQLIAIFAP